MLLKLERKFGKYAIKNLMLYMMIVYALGLIVYYINPQVYYAYLMLDIDMVLKGQVWRLFTFLIQPMDSSLLRLYQAGRISKDTALVSSVYYDVMKKKLG